MKLKSCAVFISDESRRIKLPLDLKMLSVYLQTDPLVAYMRAK